MQIPHHPDESLWMAMHQGPRHRLTLTPLAHAPLRDGVAYGQYRLQCSDGDETVTCLEPSVYERYARTRDEGLVVPALTPKTDMRWDLDPYTTARRLTADRRKPITLNDHPWPTHAPAVQVIEHWSRRTAVKVDFWCTCGFHDGLTIDTADGRLTFEDYPLSADLREEHIEASDVPAAMATQEPAPIVVEPLPVPQAPPTPIPAALEPPSVTLSKVKIQSLRRRQWSTRAILGTTQSWHKERPTRERLKRAALQLWEDTTVPTSLLQRARLILTGRAEG